MKITIVLGAFLPVPPVLGGAVEKAWWTLAKEFAGRGHAVHIVSRTFRNLPSREKGDGIEHTRVNGFDMPKSLFVLKLFDLIYSWRVKRMLPAADILVTNTFWLPLLVRDRHYGALYLHVGRSPKGQMRFYRHAARLHAPTEAIARAIRKEDPLLERSTRVLPLPIADLNGNEPLPLERRPRIILYVGRVHPEKGVHLLVRAFAQMELDTSWRLRIVGPTETAQGGGGLEYLERLRAEAGPKAEAISFKGPIFESAELRRMYRDARIFVYPSLAEKGEAFGLAPLEAMSHRCAVIVSQLDCFADFVRDSENGIVFNHRAADPAGELSARIVSLVRDPIQQEALAGSGYATARGFTPEKVAQLFLADFSSIVSG